MATYFVDLVGGNDANAGTSFATRKKTIPAALTPAVAGDTIRVMASPSPTSVGVNATWTNGSNTVTLSAPVTATISNCETAWVASANVTTTTSTNLKQGTRSARISLATAFTTGLVAYTGFSTIDLSGFQQVSFSVYSASAVPAGTLTLSLCSDAAGQTAVNTVAVPALAASSWNKVTVDLGSALGASIQSVALNALADPGSAQFDLDNIIACRAPSAADSLNLRSLISRNGSDPWFAIDAIDGTTVVLGAATFGSSSSSLQAKYWGTTGTETLYKREAITLSGETVLNKALSTVDPSLDSNCIVISGGWNTLDMSTQVGRTYLRMADLNYTAALVFDGASRMLKLSSFAVSDSYIGFAFYGNQCFGSDLAAASCYISVLGTGVSNQIRAAYLNHGWYGFQVQESDEFGVCSYYSGSMWGLTNVAIASSIALRDVNSGRAPAKPIFECLDVRNWGYGVRCSATATWTIRNTVFTGNGTDVETNGGDVYAYNTTFGTADFSGATLLMRNASSAVYSTRHQGDPTQHAQGSSLWSIFTATDQRRTPSDVSWKFVSKSNSLALNSTGPSLLVASVACPANETRRVSLWFYKTNPSVVMRLRVKGGFAAGVNSDVVSNMSSTVNAWEEVSVEFAPTAMAVVQVFAEFAGPSGSAGWIDDLTVT